MLRVTQQVRGRASKSALLPFVQIASIADDSVIQSIIHVGRTLKCIMKYVIQYYVSEKLLFKTKT